MNAIFKKQPAEPLPAFTPGESFDEPVPHWTGKRREIEATPCLPLRWPTKSKARYDLFDAWHDVAMQILRDAKVGLHVAAAAKKVTQWSIGAITDGNGDLAARAGYCSEKTISREVNAYVRLGLFIPIYEWKRPAGGKFITVRTLRFALPTSLPTWVKLPDGTPVRLDNSGPDLEAVSLDNSGPGGLDNSGPATIDHKKGGGDAA